MISPTQNDIGRRVIFVRNKNARQFVGGQYIPLLSTPITQEGYIHSFNADYVFVAMSNYVTPNTISPRPVLRGQLEWG
jgi:hypothetical protein